MKASHSPPTDSPSMPVSERSDYVRGNRAVWDEESKSYVEPGRRFFGRSGLAVEDLIEIRAPRARHRGASTSAWSRRGASEEIWRARKRCDHRLQPRTPTDGGTSSGRSPPRGVGVEGPVRQPQHQPWNASNRIAVPSG
jgi:hypothetical protein